VNDTRAPETPVDPTKTFAKAAAGVRQRNEFPHMLFVHTGQVERCPVTEENFNALASRLRKRVLHYGREENHVILQTAFIQFAGGMGRIACKTPETATWYRTEVGSTEVNGIKFRAWGQAEQGELRPARMVATGLEEFTPEECIELMHSYNPGLKGKIHPVKVDEINNGAGRMYVFCIDDTMATSLKNLQPAWCVNLGTDVRKIQYGKEGLKKRQDLGGLSDQLSEASVSGDRMETGEADKTKDK
jgi:hypothetical protein